MSDLISRADAIEAVAQQWLFEASVGNPYVNDDDIGEYRKLAEELFEDVPSADADSVVRCKDCRHSDTTGVYVEDVVYCKWLHTSCVKNGYCHRGERKGGDTE